MSADRRTGAEALFREHASFVAALVHRLGIPPADVDDVVQEVFIIAHRKGGHEPGRGSARTWLGAIAARVAANARRSRNRRREHPCVLKLDRTPCTEGDPGQALEIARALQRVQRALGELEPGHLEVFVLFEISGERCADIAASLGVPVGTVYSRLHEARRRFRAAYDDVGEADVEPAPLPQPAQEGA